MFLQDRVSLHGSGSPGTHSVGQAASPVLRYSLLTSRLGISFAYYGVILASAELLERDLVCGSKSESDSEVVVTTGDSEESLSPCYCHLFAPSDYRTMIISTLGEIACKIARPSSLFQAGFLQLRVKGKCDLEVRLLPNRTPRVFRSRCYTPTLGCCGEKNLKEQSFELFRFINIF